MPLWWRRVSRRALIRKLPGILALLVAVSATAQTPVKPVEAPAELLRDLKSGDPVTRRRASNQIGELRARNGVRPLIEALGDADAIVREAAAFALGQIGDQKAVSPLTRAIKDKDPEVRASAAFALGMLDDRKAIGALEDALEDEYVAVRSAACVAFGLLQDDEALDQIVAMLDDTSYDVRYDAAWALGQIRDIEAIDHLRAALANVDALKVDPPQREMLRQVIQFSLEELQERAGFSRSRRAASRDEINPMPERPAMLRQSVAPAMTERALRARVSGVVKAKAIIDVYGRPVRAYVTQRLGYGLDQRAVQAILQYRYDPAMQFSLPQVSWVEVEVKF
ncbi:MAG TPA: HEAT repeat domain-containing protein [Blastocatellia bacterium]|nr:HEAT repeat domain-containing protein [Blastocatellia bacterium]